MQMKVDKQLSITYLSCYDVKQEALDLLSEYWNICHQSKTDKLRALAFARAAAAVRCLPFKVTNSQQVI